MSDSELVRRLVEHTQAHPSQPPARIVASAFATYLTRDGPTSDPETTRDRSHAFTARMELVDTPRYFRRGSMAVALAPSPHLP